MNTDFRITTDALDHPKLVKLQRLCGEHGILCLFRLWAFTARYHPRGELNKMTDEDIEIAAKWNGEPGGFFSALVKLRLVDETLGIYSIHNWQKHNGYAFHAEDRVRYAKMGAAKRWAKKEQCLEDAGSNAGGNAPTPTPTPTPALQLKKGHKNDLLRQPDGRRGRNLFGEVEEEEAKPSKIPIEERTFTTPTGRAVQFWYLWYLEKHGRHYAGDIRKEMGQMSNLLKGDRVSFADVCCGMKYLLEIERKPTDKANYHPHTFGHFITNANTYIEEALEEGFHYDGEAQA